MKKLFFTLLMGLFLSPQQIFADYYDYHELKSLPSFPIKSPNAYQVSFDLNHYTGDMSITSNYAITGLNITLTGNGVTYINTTVALNAGQSFTDCLDYLSEGTYILTLSTNDGVINQYEITVEDD